ncbi:hypothetical protein PR001_g20089 [Phytophthora rubi]|uniref:Uncharacterized protein n=1 Tax=Phytophthora rubi TaxID=129364 RepID=A0A6A3JKF1_9STRA|nr:hypothetical protein PR001_g20089 [Phytophthora rubi]
MILEYKINHTDWPYLMPMVQASLNHTAVPSLDNKAPVKLFTGLPCNSVDEKSGNKLLVTWVGPYRVLRADAHSILIQYIITGAELDVHASRLKFYADASLNVTEELLEHISSQGIVLAIEKLKEHRWNDQIRDYEALVQ